MKGVYLLGGKRVAQGSLMGALKDISAPKLAANAIKSLMEDKNDLLVEEVILGQVIQAGVGQAPARQASLFAGLPDSTASVTVNKVCGSGMQAVISAAQAFSLSQRKVIIAGGMENMSLAPHILHGSREGVKFGEMKLKDSMQWDGLWDVYSDQAMGNCAEVCAKEFAISRQRQDEYAQESFRRAQAAQRQGLFKQEIAPIEIAQKKGVIIFDEDEGPSKVVFEKIPQLRPAFMKEGTITAANASTINDGAAVLLLADETHRDQASFKIVSWAHHAGHPTWFTTAPVKAVEKNLKQSGLKVSDIGVWEINEAFAIVALKAIDDLKLNPEKVNIHGGAISLGHPIGVSGARIILSLMSAMQVREERYGLATICIGGGEALSIIIEKIK